MQNQRAEAETSTLIVFQHFPRLRAALNSLELWERDQTQHGVGTVALGFDGCYWLVMVSEDLIRRCLTF